MELAPAKPPLSSLRPITFLCTLKYLTTPLLSVSVEEICGVIGSKGSDLLGNPNKTNQTESTIPCLYFATQVQVFLFSQSLRTLMWDPYLFNLEHTEYNILALATSSRLFAIKKTHFQLGSTISIQHKLRPIIHTFAD